MSRRMRKNPAFEKEMRAQPSFQLGMRERALAVARITAAGAPDHTGAFKRSIGVSGTAVTTSDPFWHLIELGSVNNPPYAPMRRGAIAAGLRLIPS